MPLFSRNWVFKKQAKGEASVVSQSHSQYSVDEESYIIPSYAKSWESNNEGRTFGDFEKARIKNENYEGSDYESRDGGGEYRSSSKAHEQYLSGALSSNDDDDEDNEDQFGPDQGVTAVDLARSFSSGKVWEDGTSPLDFVKEIATGAVFSGTSGKAHPAKSYGNGNMRSVSDDEDRVPIDDVPHDEPSVQAQEEGATVSTFINEVSSGKIWEGGASPVDFVKAIGSGEAFSIGGDTATERELENGEDNPNHISACFGKLEDFLLGENCDGSPQQIDDTPVRYVEPIQMTNSYNSSSRPQKSPSPARRQRGIPKERQSSPLRPRQGQTFVRMVGQSPSRRGRLPSPVRRKRVVQEYSSEKGRFVNAKTSAKARNGSSKKTMVSNKKKSGTARQSSPQRRRHQVTDTRGRVGW